MNGSPTNSSPDDLLQLAQTGDLEALGALLAIYRRYLAVIARGQIGRQLRAKVDASDLVQETCLEAHRHFSQFRGATEIEFRAWLRSILAGLIGSSVRHYRGTKCRDVRLERPITHPPADGSAPVKHELATPSATPSEQVARRETSGRLDRAIEELPPDYRQVIFLRHRQGLPFGQVAAEMGRSVDSVEKLWLRALGQLRARLRDLK
jgi:RNA polymerase sigma-70 factor (ECF subfamily)